MPVSSKVAVPWMVVALTGLVLVPMVHAKPSRHHIQEATMKTKEGTEQIQVDPDKGQEEVDIPDRKFQMIRDFKRGITVYKMTLFGSPACYLQPLNKTELISPRSLAWYMKKGGDLKHANGKSVTYDLVIADEEVPSISFLSSRARSMCQGLSVHWLLPQQVKGGRQKRFFLSLITSLFNKVKIGIMG